MSKKPPACALSTVPADPSAEPTTNRSMTLNLKRPDTAHRRAIGGSARDGFNDLLLAQVLHTYWVPSEGMPPEVHQMTGEMAAIGMAAFKPKTEVEAMLAAQFVGHHFASMEALRRAMLPNLPVELAQLYRKAASNASRVCIELAGAVDRQKGKHRHQVVRVEKVLVEAGGQAVVGLVNGGGGGGDETAIEGEAHV